MKSRSQPGRKLESSRWWLKDVTGYSFLFDRRALDRRSTKPLCGTSKRRPLPVTREYDRWRDARWHERSTRTNHTPRMPPSSPSSHNKASDEAQSGLPGLLGTVRPTNAWPESWTRSAVHCSQLCCHRNQHRFEPTLQGLLEITRPHCSWRNSNMFHGEWVR